MRPYKRNSEGNDEECLEARRKDFVRACMEIQSYITTYLKFYWQGASVRVQGNVLILPRAASRD